MALSSSPQCTFHAQFFSSDYSFARHFTISQGLHPSLQHHNNYVELGIVANRFQPIITPGAQPATTSSYSSSTEQVVYGRRPRYIIASDDTKTKGKNSLLQEDMEGSFVKEEMEATVLSKDMEAPLSKENMKASSGEDNHKHHLALDEDMAAKLSSKDDKEASFVMGRGIEQSKARSVDMAENQRGNIASTLSRQPASDSSSHLRQKAELKETYISDAREVMKRSISQVRDEEASLDSEPSMPVTSGPINELKRLPINLDLELYRARCLFRQREVKEAEDILRQCIKDWPIDGRAYVLLGTRLMKQGRFVDARSVYEDGCQTARGENPYIWQAWAMLEQKLGHISEARKLFDAATAADVKHVAAWHGWAVLELQQGSSRKARELLSKGIKFAGGNEYLYQTSALIEYKAGKVEEARALFSQAVHCNPKSCASWLAWALMESEQGNACTARYLFQRGVRASPKNRYTWQAWALFESNQGKKDWARRLFEQGLELNPYDAVLLQAFALFEYNSSNPGKARELFKLASSADPKHQPVWNGWGWMEWKEGNLDLARQYYRKAISVNSRNADAARAFHAWAVLEVSAENYSAARELLKCTLRVDSQNAPAWTSWARLEENVGNTARAEEIRTQYLQQRTEVMEEAPWDVSFSSMFAPAINRIKDFFKIQIPSYTDGEEELMPEILEVMNRRRLDLDKVNHVEEFDIESFIKEVLPWKNKTDTRIGRQRPTSLNITTVAS